jgi:hypothetical protein
MSKDLLEKFLKLINSANDSDAVMGLRGAQNLFRSEKASLAEGLSYAYDHIDQWRQSSHPAVAASATVEAAAAVNMTGVPECRIVRPGVLEVVREGNSKGDIYPLPGASAGDAETIALHLKDAIVAAVINKSRFKIKLNDIKNNNGDILETVLQAEYDRPGMTPVRLWVNNRGEVGALATVLRKVVTQSLPELAA